MTSKSVLFGRCEGIEDYLAPLLQPILYLPEDIVIKQNEKVEFDNDHFIYFICRGKCDVYIQDKDRKDIFVKDLTVGDYFGEVSFLRNCPRTATVTSKNYTTLAALPGRYFKDLKTKYPEISKEMDSKIFSYKDDLK